MDIMIRRESREPFKLLGLRCLSAVKTFSSKNLTDSRSSEDRDVQTEFKILSAEEESCQLIMLWSLVAK